MRKDGIAYAREPAFARINMNGKEKSSVITTVRTLPRRLTTSGTNNIPAAVAN